MAYRTASQARFAGGLNLTDGADVIAADQAADLLNVLFLPAGGVCRRDGTQRFTSTELTNRPDSLAAHYESDGTRQLLVGNGNRVDVLDTSGVSFANVATTAGPHSFVRFAAPGSEHTLMANGADPVRRWDGAAFTTPAYTGTTPTGRFLAVQPFDNRLVCAGGDRVLFSDEGNPTTFGANNYVDLHPGSGEPITGVASFNDQTFVFKATEFFVFHSTTDDPLGEPVFNYRHVAGAGSMGPVCVAPEGVYFMDRRGVWRSRGGSPELVSRILDPLFLGHASLFYQGGSAATAALDDARLWWSQGRLYLAFTTGSTNDRLAVFSPGEGWWTLFDIPVSAMTSFRPGSRDELLFAYSSGLKHVGRYFEGSGLLNDDMSTGGTGGTAIVSRWRQGWVDYSSQDQKTIRQTKLWGEGTAQFGLAADYQINPVRWDTVTFSASSDLWGDGSGTDLWGDGLWGPANTTTPWLMSMGCPGTVLALLVRAATIDSTWRLHRVEHGFREFARGPEVVGRARP